MQQQALARAKFSFIRNSSLHCVFGIDEVALDWIQSFVTGRTQQIVIGPEKSAVSASSSGVPQGSVLGPMLFGMYVSPVGEVIAQHRVHYHQYADDMQLCVSLRPQNCVTIPSLEQCATDVSRWFAENALLLNPMKTEGGDLWDKTEARTSF